MASNRGRITAAELKKWIYDLYGDDIRSIVKSEHNASLDDVYGDVKRRFLTPRAFNKILRHGLSEDRMQEIFAEGSLRSAYDHYKEFFAAALYATTGMVFETYHEKHPQSEFDPEDTAAQNFGDWAAKRDKDKWKINLDKTDKWAEGIRQRIKDADHAELMQIEDQVLSAQAHLDERTFSDLMQQIENRLRQEKEKGRVDRVTQLTQEIRNTTMEEELDEMERRVNSYSNELSDRQRDKLLQEIRSKRARFQSRSERAAKESARKYKDDILAKIHDETVEGRFERLWEETRKNYPNLPDKIADELEDAFKSKEAWFEQRRKRAKKGQAHHNFDDWVERIEDADSIGALKAVGHEIDQFADAMSQPVLDDLHRRLDRRWDEVAKRDLARRHDEIENASEEELRELKRDIRYAAPYIGENQRRALEREIRKRESRMAKQRHGELFGVIENEWLDTVRENIQRGNYQEAMDRMDHIEAELEGDLHGQLNDRTRNYLFDEIESLRAEAESGIASKQKERTQNRINQWRKQIRNISTTDMGAEERLKAIEEEILEDSGDIPNSVINSLERELNKKWQKMGRGNRARLQDHDWREESGTASALSQFHDFLMEIIAGFLLGNRIFEALAFAIRFLFPYWMGSDLTAGEKDLIQKRVRNELIEGRGVRQDRGGFFDPDHLVSIFDELVMLINPPRNRRAGWVADYVADAYITNPLKAVAFKAQVLPPFGDSLQNTESLIKREPGPGPAGIMQRFAAIFWAVVALYAVMNVLGAALMGGFSLVGPGSLLWYVVLLVAFGKWYGKYGLYLPLIGTESFLSAVTILFGWLVSIRFFGVTLLGEVGIDVSWVLTLKFNQVLAIPFTGINLFDVAASAAASLAFLKPASIVLVLPIPMFMGVYLILFLFGLDPKRVMAPFDIFVKVVYGGMLLLFGLPWLAPFIQLAGNIPLFFGVGNILLAMPFQQQLFWLGIAAALNIYYGELVEYEEEREQMGPEVEAIRKLEDKIDYIYKHVGSS